MSLLLPLSGASLLLGYYATWYLKNVATQPRVLGSERMQSFLLKNVPCLRERTWLTWWAPHPIISTIGRLVFQRVSPVSYRREILQLKDGGHVALDWNDPEHYSHDTPVVIILPGISGCSTESYVLNSAAAMRNMGYRCVVFNNRGQGGIDITTPRAYNAASCDDLCEVVLHAQNASPQSPLAILGFSMGGMISSHFFGEYSRERSASKASAAARRASAKRATSIAECNIVTGVSVSMPWTPHKSRVLLESTLLNRCINRHLTGNLRALVLRNSLVNTEYKEVLEALPGGIDHICKSSTISEFDQRCVVPAFGFSSLDDYYSRASPLRHIAEINFPVLYIHAEDDMFMPGKDLPLKDINASRYCGMVVTKWGGHIGFMQGTFPRGETYCENLYGQYIRAAFNHGQEVK